MAEMLTLIVLVVIVSYTAYKCGEIKLRADRYREIEAKRRLEEDDRS